jgi:hypothetical protein
LINKIMSNNQSQTAPVQAPAAPPVQTTPPVQDLSTINLKNIPDPTKPSKGKIAGITIGVILFIGLIIGIYFLVTRSKDKDKGVNWLAVGDGDHKILSSEDGIDWTTTKYIFPAQVNAVAYGTDDIDQTLWVAATDPDGTQDSSLVYSYDGNNWLYGTGLSFNGGGYGIAYGLSSDDTTPLWVAVGSDTTVNHNILYSLDGQSWKSALGSFTNQINSVAYGLSSNGTSGKWIAVGDQATILGSSNGQTWSPITPPAGQTSVTFESVAYGLSSNGTGVWVATGSSTGNSFIYSIDGGVSWKEDTENPFTTTGNGVAFGLSSNGTSLWVGVGEGSITIKNSVNVRNWNDGSGVKFSGGGNGVAYGENIWVAAGDGRDELLYSNDGQSWKPTSGAKFSSKGLGVASKYLNSSLESKRSKLFP